MKLHVIVIALLCVVAYVVAEKEKSRWTTSSPPLYRFHGTDAQNSFTADVVHEEIPQLFIDENINDDDLSPNIGLSDVSRFRREVDSQKNSETFQRSQSSNGPNRQPSWDVNFNRNIANNDRTRVDVFGGVSKVPGQRAQPHFGIEAERNFGKNGFIRGSGQVQPGRAGHRVSPSFGITGGFRFRREVDPQRNSVTFQGSQSSSGPNRQPSWDVNFNRNIANNDRTKVDVFGGVNKVPGQRAQPHFGIEAERNFGKDGFIRGSGQLQPGRAGHGVSPSFGITGGFRFRREAELQLA